MSASRTPHLPHTSIPRLRADDPDTFTATPIRIGAYQLWFSCDAAAPSDRVTVCIDLGEPPDICLDDALHVMLGLCLHLPASLRGTVAQHPHTDQLIYRFAYPLHDDPSGARLVEALATLAAATATSAARWAMH
ncbi:hypothetical protein [Ralstonia sp. A12]|uniref:hypothetical protein n=1 Tax=Ralstonia sp. A12 TaxID=1217052 RepID=UPI000693978F|nr:hypothetical protein [Ralstonia sp. A12]